MRTIAHLIQYFEVGGIERLVLSLGRGAEAHGVRTIAIAYSGEGPFRAVLEDAGIETVFIPSSPGIQVGLPLRLAAELRTRRVDLLQTHHVGPFLYGGAAARLLGLPHLHVEHSRELYDTPRRRAIGRFMPRVAHVAVVSEELGRYRALAFGDIPEVIPNGVPLPPPLPEHRRRELRASFGVTDDQILIGAVGRLAPEKGHIDLVKAMASLPAQFRLLLVGDGPERAALEAASAALVGPGASRVIFAGFRSDIDVLLPTMDVFAMPSLREGLPLALLEAMGHGLPVVASAVGEMPAVLALGGGTVVPPRSPDALAQQISRYVERSERVQIGASARRVVESNYSSDAMLSRYRRCWDGLLTR